MADKPQTKNLLPNLIQQNPAPFTQDSQARKNAVRAQVDRVMEAFYKLLPSNYVSQVPGPYYTIQFQAAAERIAEFQVTAQEVMADSLHDYTRSEVLFQILGSLVFPDAESTGYPDLEGDLTYRTFLKRMVELLLQGATAATMKEGIELLTTATVEILERGVAARKLKGKSAWGPSDMFTFEVNVSQEVEVDGDVVYTFPADTFTLQRNVQIVLRALKPAHTLYAYRHLFKEAFGEMFTEGMSFNYNTYHYQDYRRYWIGAERLTSESGETLTDRTLFSDPTRDFSNIQVGAKLIVETGPNSTEVGGASNTVASLDEGYVGHYQVLGVLGFPIPNDATPRAYRLGSGGEGTATVSDGYVVTDTTRNWALLGEGETLEFLEGPNIGTYRLKTVMGLTGGPIGFTPVGATATQVKVAPSILRVRPRMAVATTGQQYRVDVDRLGVQVPHTVTAEDATAWFVR